MIMADSRLFMEAGGKSETTSSSQEKKVAEELTQRIKEQIGMIAGNSKFIDAFSKLSSMINDPKLHTFSVKEIIDAWKNTRHTHNVTYNDILYVAPLHSNLFLSQAVDFLFDQQQFVKSLEENFGKQQPNAVLQKNTVEYN